MTGYGRSQQTSGDVSLTVEIKSVNHRFFEVVFRMPKQLMMYEEKIKKVIHSFVSRGRFDVFITIDEEALVKRKVKVDHALIQEMVQAFSEVKKEHHIHTDLSLNQILQFEEAFSIVEEQEENEQIEMMLIKAITEAMGELSKMRQKEGEALCSELQHQINHCRSFLNHIEKAAPIVCKKYQERLEKRMKELLHSFEEWDEHKLLTEVAIFSDKCDITEECARLTSHFQQFMTILQEQGPVGRKLDFLIQEMNREVNTIGSKASDIDISQSVVEMKSAIEKMKEQGQNIE